MRDYLLVLGRNCCFFSSSLFLFATNKLFVNSAENVLLNCSAFYEIILNVFDAIANSMKTLYANFSKAFT